MSNLKIVLLAFAAAAIQSCAIVDPDRDVVACGGNHRLQIVDLETSPDPLSRGQRINRWLVRLRADGTGECRTVIRIREADGDEIARETKRRLRPGMNEIEIAPDEGYRFSRKEHCFQVVADIAGTWRPIDAARRFCAREIANGRWSMR